MAEISAVFVHDIKTDLYRWKLFDVSLLVEVARVHDGIARRIAENRYQETPLFGPLENTVPCRNQLSVSPAFQQIANVATGYSLDRHCLSPVTAVF